MSMPRLRRTGLVLCAIALLVAGCSGSGSSGGTSSPVPQGLGGPGTQPNGHHIKHHSGKPTKHHHKGGGATSSSSPSGHPTQSATQTTGGTPTRTRSSSTAPTHPH